MASCKFVLTLVKDDNEDDYLRETWRSLVVLRGAYLYHVNKLRRKRNSKRLREQRNQKSNEETVGSGRTKKGNSVPKILPDPKLVQQGSSIPSVPVSSVAPQPPPSQPVIPPSITSKSVVGSVPVDPPPPTTKSVSKAVASTTVTTQKAWVDIVSPPKPVPPSQPTSKPVVLGKEVKEARPQPPSTSGEKGVAKSDPPKATVIVQEKKTRKIIVESSSSSSESNPKPKTKTTTARSKSKVVSEIDWGRYKQWIREWSREGLEVRCLKTLPVDSDSKLKLYCVWVGRSQGIYKDWESCRAVVDKYQGARYKKCEGTLVQILTEFRDRLEPQT